MNARVTATFRAPKNSGKVFGNAIFQKIVNFDAPKARKMSLYSGSSVERPIETETAIGKKEIKKAMSTVLKSCCPTNINANIGTIVAFGMALKPISKGYNPSCIIFEKPIIIPKKTPKKIESNKPTTVRHKVSHPNEKNNILYFQNAGPKSLGDAIL